MSPAERLKESIAKAEQVFAAMPVAANSIRADLMLSDARALSAALTDKDEQIRKLAAVAEAAKAARDELGAMKRFVEVAGHNHAFAAYVELNGALAALEATDGK